LSRRAYDERVIAAVIAGAAAFLSLLALVACWLTLRKVRAEQQMLQREIAQGKGHFDAVVAQELEERSEELARTLARSRADSISQLAEEERRIAEERRRDVSERERDATLRLGNQLLAVQGAVEQRVRDWAGDVAKLQQGLDDELKRVEARQRQLMAEVMAKVGQDAEGLQSQVEEQKQTLATLRLDLKQATDAVIQQSGH
jgi:hypothetical protein